MTSLIKSATRPLPCLETQYLQYLQYLYYAIYPLYSLTSQGQYRFIMSSIRKLIKDHECNGRNKTDICLFWSILINSKIPAGSIDRSHSSRNVYLKAFRAESIKELNVDRCDQWDSKVNSTDQDQKEQNCSGMIKYSSCLLLTIIFWVLFLSQNSHS